MPGSKIQKEGGCGCSQKKNAVRKSVSGDGDDDATEEQSSEEQIKNAIASKGCGCGCKTKSKNEIITIQGVVDQKFVEVGKDGTRFLSEDDLKQTQEKRVFSFISENPGNASGASTEGTAGQCSCGSDECKCIDCDDCTGSSSSNAATEPRNFWNTPNPPSQYWSSRVTSAPAPAVPVAPTAHASHNFGFTFMPLVGETVAPSFPYSAGRNFASKPNGGAALQKGSCCSSAPNTMSQDSCCCSTGRAQTAPVQPEIPSSTGCCASKSSANIPNRQYQQDFVNTASSFTNGAIPSFASVPGMPSQATGAPYTQKPGGAVSNNITAGLLASSDDPVKAPNFILPMGVNLDDILMGLLDSTASGSEKPALPDLISYLENQRETMGEIIPSPPMEMSVASSCVLPGECKCGDDCQCPGCSTHSNPPQNLRFQAATAAKMEVAETTVAATPQNEHPGPQMEVNVTEKGIPSDEQTNEFLASLLGQQGAFDMPSSTGYTDHASTGFGSFGAFDTAGTTQATGYPEVGRLDGLEGMLSTLSTAGPSTGMYSGVLMPPQTLAGSSPCDGAVISSPGIETVPLTNTPQVCHAALGGGAIQHPPQQPPQQPLPDLCKKSGGLADLVRDLIGDTDGFDINNIQDLTSAGDGTSGVAESVANNGNRSAESCCKSQTNFAFLDSLDSLSSLGSPVGSSPVGAFF